jgi:glutathione S-transferase
LRTHMYMDCRARRPGEGMTDAVKQDIDRITTMWRDCRRQFAQSGDFLLGAFSIADAMYAPVVLRFITYGVALDPVCQAYADTIVGLPAMQEWLEAAIAEPEVLKF